MVQTAPRRSAGHAPTGTAAPHGDPEAFDFDAPVLFLVDQHEAGRGSLMAAG